MLVWVFERKHTRIPKKPIILMILQLAILLKSSEFVQALIYFSEKGLVYFLKFCLPLSLELFGGGWFLDEAVDYLIGIVF